MLDSFSGSEYTICAAFYGKIELIRSSCHVVDVVEVNYNPKLL